MSVSTPVASRRRRLLLHWGPLLLLAIVLLILVGIDRQLKHTALRGYALEAAEWKLESDDFPQRWTQWEGSSEYALLQESAPPFMSEAAVAVRKMTGVRPTPGRLEFWLGPSGVVSGKGEDWVFSCRPGVAMHLVTFFHQWVAESPAAGTYRWGDVVYAWRDGFLLAGSAVPVVQHLAQSGLPVERGGHGAEGLSFAWDGEYAGRLTVDTEAGLPFRLTVDETAEQDDSVLHFTTAWPDAMLLLNYADEASVSALCGAGRALAPWVMPGNRDTRWTSYVEAWWDSQLPPLPAIDCAGEQALVAFVAQEPGELRSFEVGQLATHCAPSAASDLEALKTSRPYQWEGQRGWLLSAPSYVGPRAVTLVEDTLIWANEPTRMPSLLEWGQPEAREGHLYLRAEWEPTMRTARHWVLALAEQELLPGYNVEDLRSDWVPYVDALASWSHLEATGRFVDGRFLLEGHLAQPGHGG